jgi:hypothetical protein
VNRHHMMFEMHQIVSRPLSLAHRMVTRFRLVKVPQMKILHMVPHIGNTRKIASPLVVQVWLVPNTEDTLGLAQDDGGSHLAAGRDRERGRGRGRRRGILSSPYPYGLELTAACESGALAGRRARSWHR